MKKNQISMTYMLLIPLFIFFVTSIIAEGIENELIVQNQETHEQEETFIQRIITYLKYPYEKFDSLNVKQKKQLHCIVASATAFGVASSGMGAMWYWNLKKSKKQRLSSSRIEPTLDQNPNDMAIPGLKPLETLVKKNHLPPLRVESSDREKEVSQEVQYDYSNPRVNEKLTQLAKEIQRTKELDKRRNDRNSYLLKLQNKHRRACIEAENGNFESAIDILNKKTEKKPTGRKPYSHNTKRERKAKK